MAKYSVNLTKKAAKQLDKLPDPIPNPILKSIVSLVSNPRATGFKNVGDRKNIY